MALSLNKTFEKSSKSKIKKRIESSDESLLEIILDHKEERSRRKQKGELKANVKRPWDSKDSDQRDLFKSDSEGYNKSKVASKSVMQPYKESKAPTSDEKLKSRVVGRASEIFSDLDF
ncbi:MULTISPECIES: hypothetical protein [Halobacteriovorax]|uniref:Uncharacterized protein n=1 Tax=Halobacteriovorax vibrionivorans TaxID=2152716 RepID=A0ABY0IKW3_9BACT|nr:MULTISPECIES: hypothetical protein [Halobacteriovorax]RZF22501.1 hypothetical protein DAY19_01645 [Halobacteriovorax vibrionivorans]TGD47693.1 hypothetical protein EP118_07010 [Halobacteriovorax sp. Y22]